jgi:PmbA protein
MTFLRDKMGQRIFPAGVNIVDDPTIPRGLGSGVFDIEGVARRKLLLVEDGILKTWTTGVESARKLKTRSTGHASGNGNLSMTPGKLSPAELIADIREGLYVTEFMGGGGNILTGDYSRGASGFVIRDGKVTEQAVSEVTLGGTLGEIFANLAAANDFDPRDFLRKGKTLAPTIRVEGLTIGGK